MITNQMQVHGITCGKCVKAIEKSLISSTLDFKDIKVAKDTGIITFLSKNVIKPETINLFFKENDISKYTFSEVSSGANSQVFVFIRKLFPLILIFSYLLLTVLTVSFTSNDFSVSTLMSNYMGGFFIIFSFFKFLNLQGFVDAFQTYDPIAKKWRNYGYFYAAFELFAGVAYLVNPMSLTLNIFVVGLLTVTSIGVWKAVQSKKTIQCACLGTVFNLPMTYVTIFENLIMIMMASVILIYQITYL